MSKKIEKKIIKNIEKPQYPKEYKKLIKGSGDMNFCKKNF